MIKSKTIALLSASSLVLLGTWTTSARASDTPTPTPSVSATVDSNTDVTVDSNTDVQSGDSVDQVDSSPVDATQEDQFTAPEDQQGQDFNNSDDGEQASLNADLSAAQSEGDSEDVTGVEETITAVTALVDPVVADINQDDVTASDIINK